MQCREKEIGATRSYGIGENEQRTNERTNEEKRKIEAAAAAPTKNRL